MAGGCFLVVVGGILGALCGAFGSVPAMLLVGGGHSHNDMFLPPMAGIVGLVVGAFLGPRVIGTLLAIREGRRADRANGFESPSLLPFASLLFGAFVACFAAFAAFYYSTSIAELPADAGGPVWNPHPVWRARATLFLAITLVAGSGLLLSRALKAASERRS